MYQAKVYVTLKKSVFDPQGDTVLHALHSMQFSSAEEVRVGKYFEVSLKEDSKEDAEKALKQICDRLLVNPVIEDYTFDLIQS